MGKLVRGPLMVTIPLLSLLIVAVIGIAFGLLFIEVTHAYSADATLIVAVVLTAAIMAVAGVLSYMDYKNPRTTETHPIQPTARSRTEPPAGPRAPVTARPARGRSRSDGRRKSR